jgi:hypothetical protein
VSAGVEHTVNCDRTQYYDHDSACSAPTNLSATAISQTQIDLSWDDNSWGEDHFIIERSSHGISDFHEIGRTGTGVHTFSDNGVTCGQTYDYRVRAIWHHDDDHTDWSNVANATTFSCKTDANCDIHGYSGVYDGTDHGATGTCTGIGSVVLDGLDLGETFSDVPGGTADWTFDGGDDYFDESGSVEIDFTKAEPTCDVSGYSGVYDAAAHGASGSCTGVLVEELSGLDLGASFTNVPGGTADWVFTDITGNYFDDSGSAAITISKATPVITFDPAPNTTFTGGTFYVHATTTNTDSGSLTYSKVSGPCIFIGGSGFTEVSFGVCRVQANGAATTNFFAASAQQNVYIDDARVFTPGTNLIPVTGGELVDLGCALPSTLETPNGYKVEFLSILCGYQASLTEEITSSELPAPVTGTFSGGLTVNLVQGGTPQNILPGGANARFSIPMPAGSNAADYKVMFWDANLNNGVGGWVELPATPGNLSPQDSQHQVIAGLSIVNGFAQFTTNFVGTFVIVHI